jgi:hypothetical protein
MTFCARDPDNKNFLLDRDRISHPPPPPVIEPSRMTGTASECQNCYPPKDEIIVNENLVYIFF